MTFFRKIPFFLFLLPCFFCLHGAVEYYQYLGALAVIKLGLIISAAILFVFVIVNLFTKNFLFSALITFYLALWNLFFGALHDWLRSFVKIVSSYSVLIPLLLASTVLWIIFLKKRQRLQKKLLWYFNILLLVYCLFDVVLLSIKYFNSNQKYLSAKVAFDTTLVTSKPDIYYLLFDGYPGFTSLQTAFGYQSDSIKSFFNKNKFTVLPAYANYNFTYYSMSSVFNMEYVKNIPAPDSIGQMDYLDKWTEVKNGRVFSVFSSMNYTIQNLSIFDVGKTERLANNETVPVGVELLTHKIFYRKFFKEAGWVFVHGKYELTFLKKFFLRKDDFNRKVERKLIENLNNKSDKPVFAYAHFFLPHAPLYFDSTGNYLPAQIINNKKTDADKNYFLGYVKYTNTKIISVASEIIRNNPDAVIVIMSDHGFGYFTEPNLKHFYFDNICAVRFPDSANIPLPVKIGGVNFFRYFFNRLFNQKFPYLKDSTVLLKDYSPG